MIVIVILKNFDGDALKRVLPLRLNNDSKCIDLVDLLVFMLAGLKYI